MSDEQQDEKWFAYHLWFNYRLKPEDVEPSETQGYWRIKKPCGGLAGGCRNQIHTTIGNEGPSHHTVSYYDHDFRDERGRFRTQHRTWRRHKAATELGTAENPQPTPAI